jgi:hypothetical protein
MRKTPHPKLEGYRIWDGQLGTPPGTLYGSFQVGHLVILSSGIDSKYGWEHVSVSCQNRTPTWEEMCAVKDMFWEPDELVVQYHPREVDYVNHHPHCLHLWRPMRQRLPTPPTILVGPKEKP